MIIIDDDLQEIKHELEKVIGTRQKDGLPLKHPDGRDIEYISSQVIHEFYFSELYWECDLPSPPEKADFALLHGNAQYLDEIAECGCNLYMPNGEHVDWLFALGGEHRTESRKEEAREIKNRLLSCGVPRERIFVDAESYNTPENAFAARLLLRLAEEQRWREGRAGVPLPNIRTTKKVIVVAVSYHSRRAMMTDKRWLAYERNNSGEIIETYHLEYYPYPYEPPGMFATKALPSGRREARLRSDVMKTIFGEYLKIYEYLDKRDIMEVQKAGSAYR